MEVKIPGVQLLRKRSDRGDLISAQTNSKLPSTITMSNLWKASLQQATQNWMTTVLGLLKSGKLRPRRTTDRGDLIKFLGEEYEKFDLFTRKFFSAEPRNPFGTRKHFVKDRGDLISILKKRQDLNNSSLETMKQNWICQ